MSWKAVSLDNDLYTYEYILSKDVCRICLSQNSVKEIAFSAINVDESKWFNLQNVLQFIGIDLVKSTLPTQICDSCSTEVQHIGEFHSFCQESQRKLINILEQGPLKCKNEPLKQDNDESNNFSDIDLTQHSYLDNEKSIYAYESNISDLELNSTIDSLFENLNGEQELKNNRKVKKKEISLFYCKMKSCQFSLDSDEQLTAHNTNIHGFVDNLYKCFGCEKTFKTRRRCARHEFSFCKSLQNGYKCNQCDCYIHLRTNYERHLLAHEQSQELKIIDLFKCKECGKVLKSIELLEDHLKSHGVKKHWICDTCGRIFLRRDYLFKHKMIHEGRKMHACSQCDFKTVQKSSLTVHIRKHTGERPFACSICPQRCINSSNLHKHMRLHLGIKQYQCRFCEKKFGHKESLDEHIACIHDSCSQLFSCEDCGATYTRLRHLQRHLRTKHGKLCKKIDMQSMLIDKDGSDTIGNTKIDIQSMLVDKDEIEIIGNS